MIDLFIGCLLIAFGPAIVFLFSVVLNHSHLTVLAIVAAFYELVGILATSILWFIMPGSFNGRTATALVFGTIFQECARLAFVFSYGRGELGLAKTSGSRELPFSDFPSALSSGFGFGLMYALIVYGSILGNSLGEGDIFPPSCPGTSIFLVEAFCTLAMEVVHISLMILAFDAWRRNAEMRSKVFRITIVVCLHLLASLSTLINSDSSIGGCSLGLPLLYVVATTCVLYTYTVVRQVEYRTKGDIGDASAMNRSNAERDSIHQSAGGIQQ